jgi:Protein of unknown function (DUF4065)
VNASIQNVIHAIVSQVVERGGYVTKTKLLKLLYLFDVEYYRVHRETFTGFSWKFFHLGPWTQEFDSIVEELVRGEVLKESTSANQEYDTKFFRAVESRDTSGLFPRFADESILRSILNMWSESTTAEILDYVYFRTEPMERGVRNEALDFSCISQERTEKYTRPKSSASDKEISKLRRLFRDKLSKVKVDEKKFEFTPPRYDEEYEKAVQKIEAADF